MSTQQFSREPARRAALYERRYLTVADELDNVTRERDALRHRCAILEAAVVVSIIIVAVVLVVLGAAR